MGDKNDKSGCSATRMTNAINLGTIQVRPQGECHDTQMFLNFMPDCE